jgi:integrase
VAEWRGSVVKHRGKWTARVSFRDAAGRRNETRVAKDSRAKAVDARDAILAELRELGPDEYLRRKALRRHPLSTDPPAIDLIPRVDEQTFGDLADHYRENYAHEPRTRAGRRYAGISSWMYVRNHVSVLEAELGRDLPLSGLTFERVRALKVKRLDTPIQRTGWKAPRSRSFANVHRMLAVLRAMIRIAIGKRWMIESPFTSPEQRRDKLISLGQESERERILSPNEEQSLVNALDHDVRFRSLTAVIALLDTGARAGEFIAMYKGDSRRRVRWADVDFAANVIAIYGSKTEKVRRVGMTPRLHWALAWLRATQGQPTADAEIFDRLTYSTLHKDFARAATAAVIDPVRLHDLRHTRATRWIQGGLSESEVGHQLGHSKKSLVTRRYINPDDRTIERALTADARFETEHGLSIN